MPAKRSTGTTLKRPKGSGPAQPACGVCGARLTRYNPGPNCYAHTLDIPWKGPGMRLR